MSAATPTGRRDRLTPADVTELGFAAGWRFVSYAGAEYVMDAQAMAPADIASGARPDEIRVLTSRSRTEYGTVTDYTEHVRGTRVATGSYAAAVARAAQPSQLGPRPPRPVDLVRRLPALRGRSDTILAGPERRDAREIQRDLTRLTHGVAAGGPGAGAFVAATPAAVGPAAIVERLASKGVALTITPGGRLLATTPGGHMGDDVLAVLTRCERLIVGHLTGHPVLCELEHDGTKPEAITVLAVDVPACGDHAAGREVAAGPEATKPRRGALGRFLPPSAPAEA